MGSMSKDQLLAVVERAVKTFAQALVAFILTAEVTNIVQVDWAQAAGVAALASVLSVLTSLASWNVGEPGPSLGPEIPADEYKG